MKICLKAHGLQSTVDGHAYNPNDKQQARLVVKLMKAKLGMRT